MNPLQYEKPIINKLQAGLMNKFGPAPVNSRRVREKIDDVPIDYLASRFGSPLFVYSEKTIRRKHRDMYQAFSTRYPDVKLAWSYKTNYLGAICALMHREGSMAEVVSQMEYEKALGLGIPGDQIIFNGPYKPLPLLEATVSRGVIVNVDHLDEIDDLESLALKIGRSIPVGIRLNLDAGIYPMWSRFGFNLESGQAFEAIRRIASAKLLIPRGLHCHIGTFILEPEAYKRQLEKMVAFAYEIEKNFGCSMEFIDIGGGLPSRNRLKNTYLPADIAVPSIDKYAQTICSALLGNLRPGHFPRLILESGRALIDEAGTLITTIVAVKRLADGTRAYIVDAGVNLLVTSAWYRFNIETDRQVEGLNEQSIIYGPLCMNIDVVDEGLMLPPLNRGTRIIISPVGAYNNAQWLQFIHYRPNVVLITEKGDIELIRKAEDLTDINSRENMPSGLERDSYHRGTHERRPERLAA